MSKPVIIRYDLWHNPECHCTAVPKPAEQGQWVLYTDVDAHLATQGEELKKLKENNKWMLEKFTAMRLAAGGNTDTMEEAIKRVATLRAELEMFKGIFGEHDASPRTIEQARMMWDTLKAELEGVRAERAQYLQASETWNRRYRDRAQEAEDERGKLGIDIVELDQQLAEATNHAVSLSNDITHLGEQLAAREEQQRAVEKVRDEYYAQYIEATESEDRLRGRVKGLEEALRFLAVEEVKTM